MLEIFYVLRSRILRLISLSIICTAVMFGTVIYNWFDIDEKTVCLAQIYAISDCVHQANQHIRAATFAPTAALVSAELAKRMDTRKIADEAYNAIDRQEHLPRAVCREYEATKAHRNGAYRTAQNHVVQLIESGVSDEILWREMQKYQVQQEIYQRHLNTLARLTVDDLQRNYRRMLWIVAGFVGLIVLIANLLIGVKN